jgi:transposase-like protein
MDMDEAAFGAVERAIRGSMTSEQCVRIERLVRETVASRALEALIGEKVVDLAESRRCPQCGTVGIVKHGRDENGQQRFRCRLPLGCGRTFNALTNTPLARMRKPEVWLAYAEALGERRSLDWVHEHLGIARLTAWRWRHRLLTPLVNGPAQMLSGIVEADETYFLRSFKGHRGWKRGHPPENRPPRYRGSGATKRGLSSEQVPVVTALDRAGGVVEAVLDGRREDDIVIALCGSITPGSLICSDGLSAYPKLADLVASEHRTIEPVKPTPEQKAAGLSWRRPGTLTLGRVNGHHAVLKNAINGLFKGVSTRYLPDYLAWLRTLRNQREPVAFLAAVAA